LWTGDFPVQILAIPPNFCQKATAGGGGQENYVKTLLLQAHEKLRPMANVALA
jgi:hypothetical protein